MKKHYKLRFFDEYIVVLFYDCCLLIMFIMWFKWVYIPRPAILKFSGTDVLYIMCKRLAVFFILSPLWKRRFRRLHFVNYVDIFVLLNWNWIHFVVQTQCTSVNYVMEFSNTVWFMHNSYTIYMRNTFNITLISL